MTRIAPTIAALWLTLAPAATRAQPAPSEPPSGTVFFPGILVRPDGRPAHLNDAAPRAEARQGRAGQEAPEAGAEARPRGPAAPGRRQERRRRPSR